VKRVRQIHFRYLTDADFFNLNKPAGTEEGGGGQSYIDFPVKKVPIAAWDYFFDGVQDLTTTEMTQGKGWELPVHSIGIAGATDVQRVRIYRRRAASVSISSQTLNRRGSNRIRSWLPPKGFPYPRDPTAPSGQLPEGLCVYLVRTEDDEVWAGWFLQPTQHITSDDEAKRIIEPMVNRVNSAGATGVISLAPHDMLYLDKDEPNTPFRSVAVLPQPTPRLAEQPPTGQQRANLSKTPTLGPQKSEAEILDSLFGEDSINSNAPQIQQQIRAVRARNRKAVAGLKALYDNRCQISGDKYAFKKENGETYCEVHHLIPLGEDGADNPANMVVVNPLIHRMLHYAKVVGLDLAKIKTDSAGWGNLEITLAGESHTVRWHPEHSKRVLKSTSETDGSTTGDVK
jgi:5-methylcytosine-specific restriction protein A